MTTQDEVQQAVQRLTEEARVAVECSWPWSVVLPSDLRLLLSERAELLATVERMRGGLEKIASHNQPSHAGFDHARQIARAALTTGEATTPNAGERG